MEPKPLSAAQGKEALALINEIRRLLESVDPNVGVFCLQKCIAELESQAGNVYSVHEDAHGFQDSLLMECLAERLSAEEKVVFHQKQIDCAHKKRKLVARMIVEDFALYTKKHPDTNKEVIYGRLGKHYDLSLSRTKKIILQAKKDREFEQKVINLYDECVKSRGEDDDHIDFCHEAAETLKTKVTKIHNIIDKISTKYKKHGP